MRNPYESVDWQGEVVASVSHTHGRNWGFAERLIGAGYEHLAISNYYPSRPDSSYPLTNLEGAPSESEIPANVIGCPNAEHFGLTRLSGHANAIGSALASGLEDTEIPGKGYDGSWRNFIDDAINEMIYPGGGGISLNHPQFAWFGHEAALAMLDYSPIVLGVEVFNYMGAWHYEGASPWTLDEWHKILVTGRRCYGFAALDHWHLDAPPAQGRNMLLVPSAYLTMSRWEREVACAQAYREGRWYMALAADSPRLTRLAATATEVSVQFDTPCDITFTWARIGDHSPTTTEPVHGTEAVYILTGDEVYVRAEGRVDGNRHSLTHAIMYRTREEVDAELRRQRAVRFVVLGI